MLFALLVVILLSQNFYYNSKHFSISDFLFAENLPQQFQMQMKGAKDVDNNLH